MPPITDTNFVEIMKAKQNAKLAELMKNLDKKENPLKRELAVVILAAGLGTRMKNQEKPKVMFELNGKPIIQYVVELALKLDAHRVIPIVGHHREMVIEFLTNLLPNLPCPSEGGSLEKPEGSEDVSNAVFDFAIQEPQLGTGHAVMQTEELLKDFKGHILILSGDVPLLKYSTVEKLISQHIEKNNEATMLTTVFNDPTGYGRIVRDSEGNFMKIVEHKDASNEEKKINEINPAIYVVKSDILFSTLKKISPENKQKEYYLTDIFNFIDQRKIGTVVIHDEMEVTGINSVEQLMQMETFIRKDISK